MLEGAWLLKLVLVLSDIEEPSRLPGAGPAATSGSGKAYGKPFVGDGAFGCGYG